jgi:SAM-dependent methyltransferase
MLEDTGERYIPAPGDAHYEHPHRYLMARHLASGARVADLASGEGYGASWLAEPASCVVGIEIAEDAVRHATARYCPTSSNLRFARGALERLPLADGSVDLLTCFEAIEHVHEPEAVVSEIARVLAPAGVAIISTPNKRLHTDELGIQNPYHFSEMYLDEFQGLLGRFFETIVLLGQRTIAASWAWPLDQDGKEMSEFLVAPELQRLPETDASLEPMYVLAYCSHGRADLRSELAATSLLVDRELSLLAYYNRANAAVDWYKAMNDALAKSVTRADDRAARIEAELAAELTALQQTKLLRYTKTLRTAYGRLRRSRWATWFRGRPH